MARALFQNPVDANVTYYEFAGKSGESKLTAGVATGSTFIEVDTGDVYMYEETSETWYKQGGS